MNKLIYKIYVETNFNLYKIYFVVFYKKKTLHIYMLMNKMVIYCYKKWFGELMV